MKRIIALLMAVMLMATLFVGCGEATDTASPDTAASDLATVKENGKLVIGYTVYAPMNYTDDKGEFVGFDAALLHELLKAGSHGFFDGYHFLSPLRKW